MSRLAYTCRVDDQSVEGFVASERSRKAPIDASDIGAVYADARSTAGSLASAPVTCSRLSREKLPQDRNLEWISRKMTPSCKEHAWSLQSVVSYDKFTCNYVGKGTVLDKDGNEQRVRRPFKQWSGTLASCSTLNEAGEGLGIPDSTMHAAQQYAYWMADGDAAGLDEKDFLCRISSLPRI